MPKILEERDQVNALAQRTADSPESVRQCRSLPQQRSGLLRGLREILARYTADIFSAHHTNPLPQALHEGFRPAHLLCSRVE
jgi:hypothetical protein